VVLVMTDPAVELGQRVLGAASRGDHAAFRQIVEHYDEGLRALAYRLLGDRDRMDDVLQEAYVRAFRALPRFRGDAKLGTWLYRIVYNACLDELKSSARRRELPLAEAGEPLDPRGGVAEEVAERSRLADALAALTPEERAAVLLVDAQGFGYRSAAEVLRVPEGTVASRLNRARAVLRRALEADLAAEAG
jgi:RNA polymerase sigma-70 factor (ECF subfamily)